MDRFPEDFYFQLTQEESAEIMGHSLRFQNGTLKKDRRGMHMKYNPYVFTEQGVAMLTSVLKTPKAAEVSINIMRTFVEMRRFFHNNNLAERLTSVELKSIEHDKKLDILFASFDDKDLLKEKIFYNGQIYDAYSLLVDLIKNANKEIIIIDNYIDKTILDLLTKKKDRVTVKIITSSNKLTNLDIKKFNSQYQKLIIEHSTDYHDRFIIIDKEIYHCGASLKDLGKKCFAITKMEDNSLLNHLKISFEENVAIN